MKYKTIPHDYECAIELFTTCNYRCEYCSGPRTRKHVRRGRSLEDAQRVAGFFNSRGTWLLGMSGGEPSIHPHFYTLIDLLKDQHYFYFFTNLSFEVASFMRHTPPDRVQYIAASLHPEGDEDTFLTKIKTLSQEGYNPIAVMVSAPTEFDRIRRVAARCQTEQIPFNVSVMDGPFRNRNYPSDFSVDDADFIQEYVQEPGNLFRLLTRAPGGMNTYGLACPAGHTSFFLDKTHMFN